MPKPEALEPHGSHTPEQNNGATQSPAEAYYFNPEYWKNLRERFGIGEFDYHDLIDVDAHLKSLPLSEIALAARGDGVTINSGGLPERFNKYLNMLIFLTGGPIGPVGLQFVAQQEKERGIIRVDDLGEEHSGYVDSLIEDEHEMAPGVIHKYQDRVLMIVTGQCGAYCRYCTRGRLVGIEGAKSLSEIDQAFEYIGSHSEIKEIIFSGGDSFVLPREQFTHLITHAARLQASGQIESVRFGTRLPIHNPSAIKPWHYEGLQQIYAPNVMLHYNHPHELTLQVKNVLDQIRAVGGSLHSQSVLLKGVNDDREVLKALWRKGQKYGVTPYYMYQCDEVEWGRHFVVPIQEARRLMHQIRRELRGLAGRVRFVIDVANGHGKITVEEGFWLNDTLFFDFEGLLFTVTPAGVVARLDAAEAIKVLAEFEASKFDPTKHKQEVTVFDQSQK